jgi:hypothetical protein
MSDDPESLSGTTDSIRPWTIRAISTEVRDMAISTARAEGQSTGQWLERRIRQWCAEDSTSVARAPGVAVAVTSPPVQPVDQVTAAGQLVKLAIELSDTSENQRKDPLIRAARGTVKAMLAAVRPRG